ncbi:MAG: AbrB/MazE/SpoVT family DNA-binding domain-containing protein [Bryobacteraceae bacterium]|nr:AbrB/MazE/SpoVT family DNA-binding domain-containing protein [Bryobacteraceae bacterium]
MTIAKSKLTAQGQISVPAAVRRKLGIAPGSTIQWEERNGDLFVRREKKYTSEDIRKMLYPDGPPRRRSLKDLKEGIAEYMREKHGRR